MTPSLSSRKRQLDGVSLGGPDGRVWKVHSPRWWQLLRRARLLASKERGEVVFDVDGRTFFLSVLPDPDATRKLGVPACPPIGNPWETPRSPAR